MAATEHPVTCARCGRTLRSAASIARRYGPTCAAKLTAAARVVDLSAYRAAQVAKAIELLAHAGVVRDGRVFWSVSSDGAARYQPNPAAATCTCMAGAHGRRCYHLAAACVLAAA